MARVGLVVVSHSRPLAEAAVALARQMLPGRGAGDRGRRRDRRRRARHRRGRRRRGDHGGRLGRRRRRADGPRQRGAVRRDRRWSCSTTTSADRVRAQPRTAGRGARRRGRGRPPAARTATGWPPRPSAASPPSRPTWVEPRRLGWSRAAARLASSARGSAGGQQQRGVEGQARAEGHRDHRAVDVPELLEHQQHGGRGAVAVLGRAPAGRRPAAPRQAEGRPGRRRGCAARRGAPPSRRRPRRPSPCAPSSSSTTPPTCRASTSGTRGDSPIRKPRSVTSQVMWSAVVVSVRRDHVGDLDRRGRSPGSSTTAAAASLNSAWATTCSRSASAAGRAGWSAPGRAAPTGRPRAATKSVTAPEPGQRGVAAHVPDEQPLHPAACPGRGPAGCPAPGWRTRCRRRRRTARRRPAASPASSSAAGDRLLAQRQRLGDVPLHPGAGAPAGDVLVDRVDDRVPALRHAGGAEHPLGRPAARRSAAAKNPSQTSPCS